MPSSGFINNKKINVPIRCKIYSIEHLKNIGITKYKKKK